MKYKVEFEGDYYEEYEELRNIVHLQDLLEAHRRVSEEIRTKMKHDDSLDEKTYEFLERLRELLYIEGIG